MAGGAISTFAMIKSSLTEMKAEADAAAAQNLEKVERDIERVEREIAEVVEDLKSACDQPTLDYLRNKEGQLRNKEGQLRKDKEQLRKDKEQLRNQDLLKMEENKFRLQLEIEKMTVSKQTRQLSLVELLASKGISAENSTIRLIGKRYPFQGNLAVTQQNADMAVDVYDQARMLPNTETSKEISVGGLAINGSLFIGNDSLQIAFEATIPRVLKTLRSDEFRRAEKILQEFDSNLLLCRDSANTYSNITMFRLLQSRDKFFMLMPLFPTTLEHLPQLEEADAEKLISQVSTALKTLHERNLSHMDIKPSNICITNSGDFVVADLGSVEQFGVASQSTDAYIPSDHFRKARCASADTDWWMLAVTLCEKMFQLPVGNVATPTKRKVLDTLSTSEAVRSTGLLALLTELFES